MDALKLKPGKLIGEIKEYLTDCVAEGLVKFDDKDALLNLAREKFDETYRLSL
jgi:hypothetical protein